MFDEISPLFQFSGLMRSCHFSLLPGHSYQLQLQFATHVTVSIMHRDSFHLGRRRLCVFHAAQLQSQVMVLGESVNASEGNTSAILSRLAALEVRIGATPMVSLGV